MDVWKICNWAHDPLGDGGGDEHTDESQPGNEAMKEGKVGVDSTMRNMLSSLFSLSRALSRPFSLLRRLFFFPSSTRRAGNCTLNQSL